MVYSVVIVYGVYIYIYIYVYILSSHLHPFACHPTGYEIAFIDDSNEMFVRSIFLYMSIG